jgi:hypothetical protein
MHLSTTTKNKLQRIKYNKVGNKNQLGTLSKFLPKFEFKYEVIPNSISSPRKPTLLGQDKTFYLLLHACIVFLNTCGFMISCVF